MIILLLNEFRRVDRLSVRKFADEYYLLGGRKNYKINEIGVIIFKYIGSDITVKELGEKITSVYKIDGGKNDKQIDTEIRGFIELLLKEEIIIKVNE